MNILDRYILARFFANFAVLFSLLFVFAVSIDVILQLEKFVDAATDAVAAGQFTISWVAFVAGVFDFHGPRVFQFFGYLLGLVSVGAMAFTLAQMHRHRELVAVLASGTSLFRIAVPIVVGAFFLNVAQLFNQEFMLPRLAPLLIREQHQILKPAAVQFPVPLTPDSRGNLLMARSLDVDRGEIHGFLLIARDEKGQARARIAAEHALYDDEAKAWQLTNGLMIHRRDTLDDPTQPFSEPIALIESELSPRALLVKQYALYAQMLSLKQINEAERQGGFDRDNLARFRYSRLAGVLVNLLVLLLALPDFLLREPANLLRQSILCAAISIPATLGAFVGMTVSLPGLSPAVAVFLPVIVLIPMVLARITGVKT